MFDLVLILVYAAALTAAARYGFTNPADIYWRGLAALIGAGAAAALLWVVESPLVSDPSDRGGLPILWSAVKLVALVAVAACASAALRHALDALGTRLLWSLSSPSRGS
ncbi:MAG: hypothetical protein KJZ75_06865 [Hyphomonadaceae bacterium]|nr:hypothetical protein [Hyphomonadaceae bacterium]GIK47548.1 MAG: hypothetical protein BroJett013_02450 [Alphaproteobacteria bacterium]